MYKKTNLYRVHKDYLYQAIVVIQSIQCRKKNRNERLIVAMYVKLISIQVQLFNAGLDLIVIYKVFVLLKFALLPVFVRAKTKYFSK